MKTARITAVALALLLVPGAVLLSARDKPEKTTVKEAGTEGDGMKWNKLTPEEERVIVRKGTETPFTGEYYNLHEDGTYTCKRCGAALYRSQDEFDSGCGWPSFDDELPGAIHRSVDADGRRTEITCAHCGAHLGHLFEGEGFTPKNIRHCVNSISMGFVPASAETGASAMKTETAYFAGGCFWGTEHLFHDRPGVVSTRVGYMGGRTKDPTYKEVVSGRTGHAETVEVVFDPSKVSYEEIARFFFEIHDPTQIGRQGPDVGDQYRSEIFYVNEAQKTAARRLIEMLEGKGLRVATEVAEAGRFYEAEDYHQDYYAKTGGEPYCHVYTKRF